ncbi:H+/gluconate symporter and related permeases [Budvicia aquatica]|uniref:H+/gluconate symporter and related permeases n=1 Tax=Budvicia aquatica TaxID=82979 RepID=A0A484ZMU0_9GAMM|nr:H+/gluconate symporter and related permeases [Budvicia aquatica]
MDFIIVLGALCFLMYTAYRGYSVILMAPIAALGAVLLTEPAAVAPVFSGLFMDKMVGFIKLYFPVFLLGAVFGKVIELSGFSKSIVAAVIQWIGRERAVMVIVIVCGLLTYGGVSLFVVVFAVYPFAAEMFRQGNLPKRLIPGAVALGAFSFTMDALPGTRKFRTSFLRLSLVLPLWPHPYWAALGLHLFSLPESLISTGGCVAPFAKEKDMERIWSMNRFRSIPVIYLHLGWPSLR